MKQQKITRKMIKKAYEGSGSTNISKLFTENVKGTSN